jgi:hypothetical protein
MKTLTITEARENLGRWLTAAVRGENIGIISGAEAVKSRGQDPWYPAATATVLDNFIDYAEEDARRGEVRRSLEQVGDLELMAARLGGELKEALTGRRQFPAVPRWSSANPVSGPPGAWNGGPPKPATARS